MSLHGIYEEMKDDSWFAGMKGKRGRHLCESCAFWPGNMIPSPDAWKPCLIDRWSTRPVQGVESKQKSPAAKLCLPDLC